MKTEGCFLSEVGLFRFKLLKDLENILIETFMVSLQAIAKGCRKGNVRERRNHDSHIPVRGA